MTPSVPSSRPGQTPSRPLRKGSIAFLVAVAVVTSMENEVLIVAIFVSAGVLSYVIIPGLLVMWDRVLDHMGATGEKGVEEQGK